MSGRMAAENTRATAVREGFAFDEVALAAWMRADIADFGGPLAVEQFEGGQSNSTYKLVIPARSYVLRRKPLGQLLKGAYAIAQLYRIDHEAIGLEGFGRSGNYFARQPGTWSWQWRLAVEADKVRSVAINGEEWPL